MEYQIEGTPLPVVICQLEPGETMITERGSMSWMTPNMKMETSTNGGLGKAFGRMLSGDSIFQNRYTAQGGQGLIAFASSFPGSIRAFQIGPGRELIVQKSGFLASEAGVQLSVFLQKKLGSGFFGGEGFIMQKLSGSGIAFAEFDGHIVEYDLDPGESLVVDTGYLAAMDATCSMEIQTVPGVKNMVFGGEGIFNTVRGPAALHAHGEVRAARRPEQAGRRSPDAERRNKRDCHDTAFPEQRPGCPAVRTAERLRASVFGRGARVRSPRCRVRGIGPQRQEAVYLPVRPGCSGLCAVSLHPFRSGKDGAHGCAYLAPAPGRGSGGILHRLLRGPGVQDPARTDRRRETLKGPHPKSAAPETRK